VRSILAARPPALPDEGRRHAATARPRLPDPPSDSEKTSYFGDQHRWISLLSYLGFLMIGASLLLFISRRPWTGFLLAPLALSALAASVSLVTGSRPRRFTLDQHRRFVRAWKPDIFPSIDVFLPSAGEELEVLVNTYTHVHNLNWPGQLTVWVLDDSGRPEVRALARQWGFEYTVRHNRGHLKKAGNLRHGYEQSNSDFIAIFDADFVPRPDFLFELVPYFEDGSLGIVQSPQYFDMDKQMNWLQRAAGATQVLFYSWVQPSRDRFQAAICVGTSAIYRRAALDKAGGFAQIGHSEDVHTGVNMMEVGYGIRYIPIVVSKGLCPTGFDQFLTQQYRWCTGSMSLLFSRRFHRLKLTKMQRLCYWSGFLYYITTAVNVFAMSIPPVIMGFFAADRVRVSNYVFVLIALICRQGVIPIITRERESLLGLARVQSTYSFSHALALYDVIRRRTDDWVATGDKRRSRTAARAGRLARYWIIAVQVLLWAAIAIDVPQYGLGKFWPMIAFAVMHLYVSLPIALADADFPVWMSIPKARRALRVPAAARRVS
jgi:cellulose synthase/poly-beta-1,6-N-acetylglucosamine synthase-like glycosyltransferase